MTTGGEHTPAKMTAVEKRARAVNLRKSGMTYEEIGHSMGVTKQAAHKLVMKELKRLAELHHESANELRALELARLDDINKVLYGKISGDSNENKPPDLASIDRYLKLMERRAKLLGLDQPIQENNDLMRSVRVIKSPRQVRLPDAS